jgi:hypothetical protein
MQAASALATFPVATMGVTVMPVLGTAFALPQFRNQIGHVFRNQSLCQLFATLAEFLNPLVRHGRKFSWISMCVVA